MLRVAFVYYSGITSSQSPSNTIFALVRSLTSGDLTTLYTLQSTSPLATTEPGDSVRGIWEVIQGVEGGG